MKTKNIFVAIIAFFAVSLGCFFCMNMQPVVANAIADDTFSEAFLLRANASVELYSRALPYFLIDEESDRYSDDYAGAFLDKDGVLNIRILEDCTPSFFHESIIYQTSNYSYNHLLRIQRAIESVMFSMSISAVGIDDEENRIEIEVESIANTESIISFLSQMGIYDDKAIIFSETNYVQIASYTAYGGNTISRSGGSGTIAVNARCNSTGKIGVLTAEHVARAGDTMSVSGQTIGTPSSTQVQNSGKIDASFIPFQTQSDWFFTTYSQGNSGGTATTYNNIRTGNSGHIVKNAPTMKIGKTTGVNYGQIQKTSYTVNSGGIKKSDCVKISNEGRPGDSGGPIYYHDTTNNLYYLIAINMCVDDQSGGVGQVYGPITGCKTANIASAFGITFITNDVYNTTPIGSNDISINGISFNIVGDYVIPEKLHGRTVTEIGILAKPIYYMPYSGPPIIIGYDYNYGLTSVTIPRTLRNIGANAFMYCPDLTSVMFESNSQLTNIGMNAFANRGKLTNITIPASVTSIGYSAFSGCTNLSISWNYNQTLLSNLSPSSGFAERLKTIIIPNGLSSITIPDGVTTIGTDMLQGNRTGLTNVTIPNSVVRIGENAFHNTGIWNNTPNNSVVYADKWAVGFKGVMPSNLTFKPNTAGISDKAFYGYGMTAVTVPESVKIIGFGAFKDCNNLTNITLPFIGDGGSNTHFGYIFGSSSILNLNGSSTTHQGLYMPASLKEVTVMGGSIASAAFSFCTGFELIITGGVTSVNGAAFTLPYFSPTTNLVITWHYNTALTLNFKPYLTKVIIQNDVTNINLAVFSGCNNLAEIHVESQNQYYASQDGILYNADSTEIIYIPQAISGSITIPNTITSIDGYAFSGRSKITSITIPEGVTYIGEFAFKNCSGLSGTLELPTSLEYIASSAFVGCSGITGFYIDGQAGSASNTIVNKVVNLEMPIIEYWTEDGVLYGKSVLKIFGISFSTYWLIAYPAGKTDTEITVLDGVVVIADYAFYGNPYLESVDLGGMGVIGRYAFAGCVNLTEVIGDYVGYVGVYSFDGTPWLEENEDEYVVLGQCLIKYQGCESELVIDGFYSIAAYAFYGNEYLTRVVLIDVSYIGEYAFYGCTSLETVELISDDNVTIIFECVFDNNADGRTIIVSDNLLQFYLWEDCWVPYADDFDTYTSNAPKSGVNNNFLDNYLFFQSLFSKITIEFK